MTDREKNFCYDLAKFMCYPDSFEIDGTAAMLKGIIKNITKKNKEIRKEVLENCKEFVSDNEYDTNAYGEDKRHAMKLIREDYDCVFY